MDDFRVSGVESLDPVTSVNWSFPLYTRCLS